MNRSVVDEAAITRRRLCSNCVGEPFLRKQIEKDGKNSRCSYCDEEEVKTISIGEMADRIDHAFEQHFELTPNEPSAFEYTAMKESDYHWHRKGDCAVNAIEGAADVPCDVAEDIRLILHERHYDFEREQLGEESPFSEGAHYEEKAVDDIEFRIEWSGFEASLREEARFFSRRAESTLATIFDGLAAQKTREGRPAVIEAGPCAELSGLYRARVFQSDANLIEALKRPDLEVGPPRWMSAPAGRLNAHGISVFYGATTADTALAEVRPPIGSRVALARFELVRPMRLLDVQILREVFIEGSLFDDQYLRRLERAKFLGRLSQRITQPVMPDDEPFDYLVTQAIADYLAGAMNLDGMIYVSAQAEGQNVVLFHHAARVESLDIPTGTKITADVQIYTEDGPEPDYTVFEASPPTPSIAAPSGPLSPVIPPELMRGLSSAEIDNRMATLKINVSSLQIHHVRSAKITTDAYPVSRHSLKTH